MFDFAHDRESVFDLYEKGTNQIDRGKIMVFGPSQS